MTVTLDGSASADPNGDALTYGWTLPPAARFNSMTQPSRPHFVPRLRGCCTLHLRSTTAACARAPRRHGLRVRIKHERTPGSGRRNGLIGSGRRCGHSRRAALIDSGGPSPHLRMDASGGAGDGDVGRNSGHLDTNNPELHPRSAGVLRLRPLGE